MAMAMTFQGIFGVPRRHYDISFANAPFTAEFHPAVNILQAIMGVGGLIAALGGLIYIAIAVVSVFFGKKFTEESIANNESGIPQGVFNLPKQIHEGTKAARAHAAGTPGTMILVFIFLACFILYYFVNWKILSFLWKIG